MPWHVTTYRDNENFAHDAICRDENAVKDAVNKWLNSSVQAIVIIRKP